MTSFLFEAPFMNASSMPVFTSSLPQQHCTGLCSQILSSPFPGLLVFYHSAHNLCRHREPSSDWSSIIVSQDWLLFADLELLAVFRNLLLVTYVVT
jgi:hypothetical protein